MRVLIVEDDPAISLMLERGLAAHGYRCVSVDNGVDGAVAAMDEAVGLVLLDILLPGLGGQEVLRIIRSARAALPVLMLTARDDAANKARALDGGANGYLIKPFDLEELVARVRALLGAAE